MELEISKKTNSHYRNLLVPLLWSTTAIIIVFLLFNLNRLYRQNFKIKKEIEYLRMVEINETIHQKKYLFYMKIFATPDSLHSNYIKYSISKILTNDTLNLQDSSIHILCFLNAQYKNIYDSIKYLSKNPEFDLSEAMKFVISTESKNDNAFLCPYCYKRNKHQIDSLINEWLQ